MKLRLLPILAIFVILMMPTACSSKRPAMNPSASSSASWNPPSAFCTSPADGRGGRRVQQWADEQAQRNPRNITPGNSRAPQMRQCRMHCRWGCSTGLTAAAHLPAGGGGKRPNRERADWPQLPHVSYFL